MSIKITPKVGIFSNTVRSVEIMGIKGWISPSTELLVMWKGGYSYTTGLLVMWKRGEGSQIV